MAELDGGPDHERRRAALRRMLAGCALLIGAMMALSVWAWLTVPSDTEVVLHRDLTGEPTRTGEITLLLYALPVVAALMTAFLFAILRSEGTSIWEPEPAQPADPRIHAWFGIGIVGLFATMHAVILLEAVGVIADPIRPLMIGMGVFALLFGVLLVADRSGEALMQISVNLPRPAAPEARRALRRVVGSGFAAVGAGTVVAALAGPPWLPAVLLAGGLVLVGVSALASSLRHQT